MPKRKYAPGTKLQRLDVDIPENFHRRLKADAASRGLSVTERVIDLIDRYCSQLPNTERIIR